MDKNWGGGELVSGMVARSFSACISHTSTDCQWQRERGLWEVVYWVLLGMGSIVCKMRACLSQCVRRKRGGGTKNWRSKFIIVMAFSGIHFPTVCWQQVVSAYHPPRHLHPGWLTALSFSLIGLVTHFTTGYTIKYNTFFSYSQYPFLKFTMVVLMQKVFHQILTAILAKAQLSWKCLSQFSVFVDNVKRQNLLENNTTWCGPARRMLR